MPSTTTPGPGTTVPLLESASDVADWLDANHPIARNFEAVTRMGDHLGGNHAAMRLWANGAELAAARRHPTPGVRP